MFPSAFPRIAGAVAIALFPLLVSAAELTVRVTGIADKTGMIHIFVFTSADGFPKEENAVAQASRAVPDGTQLDLVIQVPDAPAYALMAYQDRNGDGKMNRFLGMIPQEPYAMSRNPDVMGKPKFSESSVQPANGEAIVMKLRD